MIVCGVAARRYYDVEQWEAKQQQSQHKSMQRALRDEDIKK